MEYNIGPYIPLGSPYIVLVHVIYLLDCEWNYGMGLSRDFFIIVSDN